MNGYATRWVVASLLPVAARTVLYQTTQTLVTLLVWFLPPLVNSALADPAEVILIRHAEKPEMGKDLSLRGANGRPHWPRISWKHLNCWNSILQWPFMLSGRKMDRRRSARSKQFGPWPTLCASESTTHSRAMSSSRWSRKSGTSRNMKAAPCSYAGNTKSFQRSRRSLQRRMLQNRGPTRRTIALGLSNFSRAKNRRASTCRSD